MKSLYDFSDAEIGLIIIGGGCILGLSLCLGLCGLLHGISRRRGKSNSVSGSKSGLIKEQSHSVLRGEHPIAFVLPSVSLSEPGSEMSDLESLTACYSTSPSMTLSSSFGAQVPWRHRRTSFSQGYSPSRKNRRRYSPLVERGYESADALSRDFKGDLLDPEGKSASFVKGPPCSLPNNGQIAESAIDGNLEPIHEPEEHNLGSLRVKLSVDANGDLMISEVFLTDLSTIYLSNSSKLSIRVKMITDKKSVATESGMTSIFDTKALFIDPLSIPISNQRCNLCVLKLSVIQKSSSKNQGEPVFYGYSVIDMSQILPLTCGSKLVEKPIQVSVVEELRQILAHAIEISLHYDSVSGKLTLGIIQAELKGVKAQNFSQVEAHLYTKVTLFEGRRVIKAKKTRPVGFNVKPQFHETFSILFPVTYLEKVSCIISLCSKDRQGAKVVLGRICVGPESYAEGQGQLHWTRMRLNDGATIIQWHQLA
ncbi:synaptotagmin-5-like isoform X2 [Tigriopus californicus]|uniref:synaptotagmin-5-like isoform X2 n=1 Tax=Tigriopus californicus TaxID=6832 RepID=UPI0027DA8329|nr:synaptotagmin-5-like isoform X2 [Tigriopus californicus]